MGHVESDTKNPSMVREDGSPKSRPGKDVPKINAQGRVGFRSQRKDSYIDYRRLDALFEALGFYLEKEFYFERVDPGAQLEKNRPDQIVYANKQIGDNYSLFTARAFIRNSHFTHERVFSLNRRYEYIKWGSLQVKAQRIVCIDIDGRSNKDTKVIVHELVARFGEVKYVEYNPWSKGYHLYFHFDRAATDPVLQNLEDQFKRKGFVIEAVRSTGHIRLPMSRKYSVYGIYSIKKPSLIRTMAFDELLTLWKNYDRFAYLDPSLEMDLDHKQYKKRFGPRKKRLAQTNIKQKLLDNPKLNYGAGERKEVQTSILSYCIRYGLPLQDFIEICEAHDRGARGKTDYKSFYEWGQNNFERSDSRKVFGDINYEDILDRVERYSKTIELSETLDQVLRQKISDCLIPFLSKRRNVSENGGFKNDRLIKDRYYQRIKQFILFLIRYEEARTEEWTLLWSNDPKLKLPMVFPMVTMNDRQGMPLPLSLIKFLGKHYKCKSFPEIKYFLEDVRLLTAIELKPGVTYAPGTCIYYETDRIMELQRSHG